MPVRVDGVAVEDGVDTVAQEESKAARHAKSAARAALREKRSIMVLRS
jgi:diacylglycerol kinase